MAKHGASQPGGLKQRARRILPVALLAAAVVVLWAAALSAGARCWRSPDQVMLGSCPSVIDSP